MEILESLSDDGRARNTPEQRLNHAAVLKSTVIMSVFFSRSLILYSCSAGAIRRDDDDGSRTSTKTKKTSGRRLVSSRRGRQRQTTLLTHFPVRVSSTSTLGVLADSATHALLRLLPRRFVTESGTTSWVADRNLSATSSRRGGSARQKRPPAGRS